MRLSDSFVHAVGEWVARSIFIAAVAAVGFTMGGTFGVLMARIDVSPIVAAAITVIPHITSDVLRKRDRDHWFDRRLSLTTAIIMAASSALAAYAACSYFSR